MSKQVQDTLEILNGASDVTITLTGADASVKAGDNGVGGLLDVDDAGGTRVFRVHGDDGALTIGATGNAGEVQVHDGSDRRTFLLDGDAAALTVGASGNGGTISVVNAAGDEVFRMDAATGAVTAGANGAAGSVALQDSAGAARIELQAGPGDIRVKDASGNSLMHFDSTYAALYLGGTGNEGDLVVRDEANLERIKLDAGQGDIWVKNAAGKTLFHFDSRYAALYVGGEGNEGDVVVRDGANKQRIKLDAGQGDIWVKNAAGKTLFHFDSTYAALWLGGQGNEGDLIVRDEANKERIKLDGGEGDIWVKNAAGKTLFHFDSTYAALWLGGQGNEGDLLVRDGANKERIKLDGGEGDIWVKDAGGNVLFHFDSQFAALYLGGVGNEGDLVVRNGDGNQTIKLDGGSGDIILSNADAAEDFEVANAAQAPVGTVMVLAHDGRLEPCAGAYDHKVVGVVSGAGPYRPGIVLDRGETPDESRVPISVMGKVACRADATHGSIRVGDLLTTSPTTGCAMKAADSSRAFGSIIGKALSPLEEGEDLVKMLISLQ